MLSKLVHAWYEKRAWVWLLAPLSALFWLLSSIRRLLYKQGVIASKGSHIAVIVVGNIGIGGNGKTPLVLALIDALQALGHQPAVLSRGYGGSQKGFPYWVSKDDSAQLVGDEPALIVRRNSCPVVIDPRRTRGVAFIAQQTKANVVICDDGLQHYAMKRDFEICVLDKRGIGNGYLLPMGPLREGAWRLNEVSAVVHNIGYSGVQTKNLTQACYKQVSTISPAFDMTLTATLWVNIATQATLNLTDFLAYLLDDPNCKKITALAGIGDPKRFFDTLQAMGITPSDTVAFDDHHQFVKSDIPASGCVLMTEKDAVKCLNFSLDNAWYLRIDATLNDKFFALIENSLKEKLTQLARVQE